MAKDPDAQPKALAYAQYRVFEFKSQAVAYRLAGCKCTNSKGQEAEPRFIRAWASQYEKTKAVQKHMAACKLERRNLSKLESADIIAEWEATVELANQMRSTDDELTHRDAISYDANKLKALDKLAVVKGMIVNKLEVFYSGTVWLELCTKALAEFDGQVISGDLMSRIMDRVLILAKEESHQAVQIGDSV